MDMDVRKTVKYIVSIAVAVVLVYFSFRGVDWKDFMGSIRSCRWEWIVYAMLFSILSFVIRSERWRRLMLPIDGKIGVLTTYNAVCIGYLANFVFPRIGEVVKCGVVSRRQAAIAGNKEGKLYNFDKYVGTVVMEKTFDILSVMALFAILLVAWWEKFGAFFTEHILSPASQRNYGGLLLTLAIIALVVGAVILVVHLRDKYSFCGKIYNFINGLWTGFKGCFTSKGGFSFLVYTIALWLSYIMMSYCIIRSLPFLDTMGFVDAMFVCAAGGLGWIVPAPGGIGSYHFIVALALSSIYGIAWESGLLVATLNHGAQAVTMVVCGIVSYFVEMLRK